MEIEWEIKSYLLCFFLESAVLRSEMEVVLRRENYSMFKWHALAVVDFTMLYVVTRQLLLSSRVSSLVINLFTI